MEILLNLAICLYIKEIAMGIVNNGLHPSKGSSSRLLEDFKSLANLPADLFAAGSEVVACIYLLPGELFSSWKKAQQQKKDSKKNKLRMAMLLSDLRETVNANRKAIK